jgi:ABC-type transport system substrate-binding protein
MVQRRRLIATAAALGVTPKGAWPRTASQPGERVLRLTLPVAETGFDAVQNNTDLYSNSVCANIFEAPLAYDYLARPARLVPKTAIALPEISADLRTLIVHLRRGIYFDGDPAFRGQRRELVAEDYAYTIKRYYDPRWKAADLYLFSNAMLLGLSELRERALMGRRPFDYDTPVEGARALDRYTLQIKLGISDPRFVYNLANSWLMGAVAREVVEHYGDDIAAHPVGTGPFRLAAWRRASRIELERSPSFRGVLYDGTPADDPVAREVAARLAGRTLPLVDRVVLDVVEEPQPRWLAFVNGEHDLLEVPGSFAPLSVPHGKLAPFLAKKGVRLQVSSQPDMSMTFFNCSHPLVGGYTPEKVALRRAIALSFDNAAYIRLVRGEMAIPAQSVVPPFTSGYDPDYRCEMSEHDPGKARALLDLYGYIDGDGDGWRETPAGEPLTLRIASLPDQSARAQIELWHRALRAIGLRTQFEIAPWGELLKRDRSGALMMWGFAWTAGSPDGGFFLSIAYGPNSDEANDARFALPAFDRLFERQRVMPDGPSREALMREAKNLLAAYMPYKAHAHRRIADLLQPRLQGYWRHPFMRDFWCFMGVDGPAP